MVKRTWWRIRDDSAPPRIPVHCGQVRGRKFPEIPRLAVINKNPEPPGSAKSLMSQLSILGLKRRSLDTSGKFAT